MATEYLGQRQQLTLISMDDLREFQTSMGEEFRQFSLGGFLAAGAVWAGMERLFTDDAPFKDVFFWLCVFALIAGGVIGYYGHRQLDRRRNRIQGIIDRAEVQSQKLSGAQGRTEGGGTQ